MTNDYLNKIVYQRKGTSVVIPETEANKKDPNLVPMTVQEAIHLGYMDDPLKDKNNLPDMTQTLLEDENKRLKRELEDLKNSAIKNQKQMELIQQKLAEQEATAQGHGVVVPSEELFPDDKIMTDALTPPVDSEGHDDTQTQLDQLMGTKAA